MNKWLVIYGIGIWVLVDATAAALAPLPFNFLFIAMMPFGLWLMWVTLTEEP